MEFITFKMAKIMMILTFIMPWVAPAMLFQLLLAIIQPVEVKLYVVDHLCISGPETAETVMFIFTVQLHIHVSIVASGAAEHVWLWA